MKFFGLVGEKLEHSLSPTIHKKIGAYRDLDIHYQLFEVKKGELGDAIKGLKALGAGGVNVTIPYKVDVMTFVDQISPEAVRIGSANTISFSSDSTSAFNTDYYGFAKSLKRYGAPIEGAQAVVLGAGGAARSVLLALKDFGAREVIIASRSPLEEGFQLGGITFPMISYDQLAALEAVDILVNTTPVGMYPEKYNCPVAPELIQRCDFAYDLIYNPVRTNFLEYAERAGIKNCNGLYMLVSQAAEAQRIWNHIELTEYEIDEICFSLIREN